MKRKLFLKRMCGPLVHNQIRIISDGLPGDGTAIFDAHGNKIENISSATIWIDAGERVHVDITIQMPVVSTVAEVDGITFDCKVCDESIYHNCSDPCKHEDLTFNGRCSACGEDVH